MFRCSCSAWYLLFFCYVLKWKATYTLTNKGTVQIPDTPFLLTCVVKLWLFCSVWVLSISDPWETLSNKEFSFTLTLTSGGAFQSHFKGNVLHMALHLSVLVWCSITKSFCENGITNKLFPALKQPHCEFLLQLQLAGNCIYFVNKWTQY